MKNTGGRAGGAITAASLLEEFVDSPWVHLDIAGTAWTTRAKPYIPKGGVGFGVRLLTPARQGLEESGVVARTACRRSFSPFR